MNLGRYGEILLALLTAAIWHPRCLFYYLTKAVQLDPSEMQLFEAKPEHGGHMNSLPGNPFCKGLFRSIFFTGNMAR